MKTPAHRPDPSPDAIRRVLSLVPLFAAMLLPHSPSSFAADGLAPEAALDDLLFHAQRYATTAEKRENKKKAREEILARGVEALGFLMERIHIENFEIVSLAETLVRKLPSDEVLPVLWKSLESESTRIRRFALYFLAFHPAPEHAGRLYPELNGKETRGMTIRTLGKWRVAAASPFLSVFLADEDERLRVLAANALGEIGDANAIPPLIGALDDAFFTVRRAAARALAAFGSKAETPLIAALPTTDVRVQREIVRILGALHSRAAVRPLRKLLEAENPRLRADAAAALREIAPDRAESWIRSAAHP